MDPDGPSMVEERPDAPLLANAATSERVGPSSSASSTSLSSTANGRATPTAAGQQARRPRRRVDFMSVFRELRDSRTSIWGLLNGCGMIILAGASVTVLALEAESECDSPLPLFLILQAVRLALQGPLTLYRRFFVRIPDEPNSHHWSDRLISFLDFFGTLLFVTGNWWLFSSQTCSATSPMVYDMSLTLVIVAYVALSLPIVLIMGILCCLPCILLVYRRMPPDGRAGASPELIKEIPTEEYKSDSDRIAKEDAMCAICLAEYVDGDVLKRLHCDHHFHSKCIDDWLPLSKNCPLCMQKIDGELAPHASGSDAAV